MIEVVVADDQALLRRSLAMMLDAEPDISVVGEAADGVEALEVVRRRVPDVVLLDVRMPRLDGLAVTEEIVADPALARVRVCVLTMFELDEYVFRALRAGAGGFLLKDTDPDVLAATVRRIHSGEQALSPSVLRRVVAKAVDRSRPSPPEVLTPREVEVLTLIGRGLNNAEIERELFISKGTVKTHVSHLLTKLGARDRPQLVIAAWESGLVR
ncbi:DNA-binding response regulator [Arachnia propionica]|uniref:DNA-binding response regulator n=1 Tax=Arachnia propionica TaxID=1750 RepID=A0A3P1T148_9ACTN|nr:response regulator transcription factor [Arachnia propionica]MDO5084431.1 response regulator transcription factor [Arachnia propionica]RRD03120.1 DNA-binding response regulator [Arachnia propionica]